MILHVLSHIFHLNNKISQLMLPKYLICINKRLSFFVIYINLLFISLSFKMRRLGISDGNCMWCPILSVWIVSEPMTICGKFMRGDRE